MPARPFAEEFGEPGLVLDLLVQDRQGKESILGCFDMTAMSRYFPEFEQELPRYLSQS